MIVTLDLERMEGCVPISPFEVNFEPMAPSALNSFATSLTLSTIGFDELNLPWK